MGNKDAPARRAHALHKDIMDQCKGHTVTEIRSALAAIVSWLEKHKVLQFMDFARDCALWTKHFSKMADDELGHVSLAPITGVGSDNEVN